MIIWRVSDLEDPEMARLYSSLEGAVQFVFRVYSIAGGDGSYVNPILHAIACDEDTDNQKLVSVTNGALFRFIGPKPHLVETCRVIRNALEQSLARRHLIHSEMNSEDPRITGEQEE